MGLNEPLDIDNFLKNTLSLSNFVRDYLNFSRKERIGIIVLISLIVIVFFLPSFKSLLTTHKLPANDTGWVQTMKKLEINREAETDRDDSNNIHVADKPGYEYDKSVPKTSTLFYFDPNSISQKEWKQLGLRDKTIQTIQNYLNKGGKFRKPEDLQKVYGLKQEEFDRLAP